MARCRARRAYLANPKELLQHRAWLANHGEQQRPHDSICFAADVDHDVAPLRERVDEIKRGTQQSRGTAFGARRPQLTLAWPKVPEPVAAAV
jgi:hypothetical protein